MKLYELLDGVEVLGGYPLNPEISSVTDDSRKVRNSSVFVCVKGKKNDGHDYARKALERGAAVVICDHNIGIRNCIVVENTREAYALMCANYYGNCHRKLKMIGVTGTNGKTTTTFIIKKILEENGYKVGVIGTVNVMIGNEKYPSDYTTPNPSVLHRYFYMMKMAGCDVCIIEASSQALSQERTYGIHFDIGVFTNLTREHLDYHGSMEEYAKAKAILMQNSSVCIINADDSYAEMMKRNAAEKVVTYAVDGNADIKAENVKLNHGGVVYTLVCENGRYEIAYDVIGKFSVYNSLAALAVGIVMKADMKRAVRAVAEMKTVRGRIEKIPNNRNIHILIDFAHTPDSLENVLKTVRDIYDKRIITVFGCGGDRDRTKRPLMGRIACKYSDLVYVTSDNPRTEDPDRIIDDIVGDIDKNNYVRIADRTQAIKAAIVEAEPGDTVLIAGKGHERYQILGTEKIHYDEREIVKQILDNGANFKDD
ncbi:MAG TPA: UDP-N-acetylmuramoyl-L-alanyl-D-glutamate--2,6-diaminopimelate ligase [Ruminococcaceae bacterium]|nr:UDP-N-acetylmuramoyl-L-alanyl-D-glutamate--2,6-diaminopimelate ligase [Oscillospiraceae bacterium]